MSLLHRRNMMMESNIGGESVKEWKKIYESTLGVDKTKFTVNMTEPFAEIYINLNVFTSDTNAPGLVVQLNGKLMLQFPKVLETNKKEIRVRIEKICDCIDVEKSETRTYTMFPSFASNDRTFGKFNEDINLIEVYCANGKLSSESTMAVYVK